MLGSFLTSITNTFFSRYFIVGSFFPLPIFAFINGLLLYATQPVTRHWIDLYASSGTLAQGFYATVVLIALALAAYLLSGLSLVLLEILEGKRWPSWKWFDRVHTRPLKAGHSRAYRAMSEKVTAAQRMRRDLTAQSREWLKGMQTARVAGAASGKTPTYTSGSVTGKQLRELIVNLDGGGCPTVGELSRIVTGLSAHLKEGSAEKLGDANSDALDAAHKTLIDAIELTQRRVVHTYVDTFTQRELHYRRDVIRPTKLGNIAEAMDGYAVSRYGMNLDTFWPHLQTAMQADEAFYAGVQDAKTQLDFLVAVFWLAWGTLFVWLLVIATSSTEVWWFLGLALGGAVLLWMVYDLAINAYAAFAQLIRSAVDVFRFNLLDAMQVGRPADRERERRLWDVLNQVSAYGEQAELRYDFSKKE